MRSYIALIIAAAFVACATGVTFDPPPTAVCATNDDCAPGWACTGNVCVNSSDGGMDVDTATSTVSGTDTGINTNTSTSSETATQSSSDTDSASSEESATETDAATDDDTVPQTSEETSTSIDTGSGTDDATATDDVVNPDSDVLRIEGEGQPCAEDQCVDNLVCLPTDAGQRCIRYCDDDAQCPRGMSCRPISAPLDSIIACQE